MKIDSVRDRLEVTKSVLSGSVFNDVNLSGSTFTDVNMSGWSLDDVNVSGLRVHNANVSGARIVSANLCGVTITGCTLDGMTINGLLVTELLSLFAERHPAPVPPAAIAAGGASELESGKTP